MSKNIEFKSQRTYAVSTSDTKIITFDNLEDKDIGLELIVRFYSNEEIAHNFIESGSIKVNTIQFVRTINEDRQDGEDSLLNNYLLDYSHCNDERKYVRHPISIFAGRNVWEDTTIRYTDIVPLASQTCVFCMSHLHLYRVNKDETIKDILIRGLKSLKREKSEVFAVIVFDISTFLTQLKGIIQSRYTTFMKIAKVKYVDYDPFEFIDFEFNDSYFDGKPRKTGLYERAVFSKSKRFKDENELRVAFENTKGIREYDIFEIGPLNKIAFIVDLREV